MSPRKSQKAHLFETPERSTIIPSTREHVAAMETSGDPKVWVGAGMHHLMLRMTGRKSGEERKVALPFWEDDDGHRIVVGSYAGDERHPGWVLNLQDRETNPEVYVRFAGGAYWADAEFLDGDDYIAVWSALCEDRPFYRDYQARTERRIPLIRLREKRPA